MNMLIHDIRLLLWAIVVAILAAHALDRLVRLLLALERSPLIPILELFVVLFVGFLAIHSSYASVIGADGSAIWYDRPLPLVVSLLIFVLCSMGLYIVSMPRRRTRTIDGGQQ